MVPVSLVIADVTQYGLNLTFAWQELISIWFNTGKKPLPEYTHALGSLLRLGSASNVNNIKEGPNNGFSEGVTPCN